MIVELKPHTGYQHRGGARVLVELAQKVVYVDGKKVAYTNAEPGAPISFNRHYPPAFTAEVAAEVTRIKGGEAGRVSVPPKPEQPGVVDRDE